jgi:hypothetical protein
MPLGSHILEGGWVDNRKGHQEDIGLRIGQRSQSVVIFLAGGIPKAQIDWLSIDHHIGRIVIEDSSAK